LPILEHQSPVRPGSDDRIVRHHDNAYTKLRPHCTDEVEYLPAIAANQVAGWFISEDRCWLCNECAGDRNALLFPAGK